MIYIIDHQDSFTWNVVHQFSQFDKVYCSDYFDINKKLSKESKKHFINFVEESFSKIMETGKDHIAISIREFEKDNLSLGRAKNEYICLMNLDIRAGRTDKQKIKLIKTLISGVEDLFLIKKKTSICDHYKS